MTDNNTHFSAFLAEVKTSQVMWALQDGASEGWVILDSINFENTDVMPLWSNKTLASSHCVDEWQDYTPVEITVADWLEFWVEDLAQDNIMIGVNWQGEDEYLELELADFSQKVAEVEKL
ncbi:MAG: DUF2750 domain-containing protein [Paraglaciecola sp.]|uniref:DUF2750 domain-containing protein n=1 Tax=Flavobacterium sp. W21_SRS_FM6 TaxID=3240268 RepID=UPI00276267C3|nr:DUF2750 domain-containing protein [Paraglaciecola sp.]MDP5133894.1 DUF2750 domain-containing protein [Paraglaciecola sp.]